ncbi:hypothetical protein AMTR_s00025p00217130 [Amborella trichopoda]|uniref:SBP-type domain-containing protein n=1 Tax=Amborella trichopoda TaxID=13333 RepID=W1PXH9_AMBTC|nr:hypothetical protein AMTR_s00025p00217130 [Amborella trichopoda]
MEWDMKPTSQWNWENFAMFLGKGNETIKRVAQPTDWGSVHNGDFGNGLFTQSASSLGYGTFSKRAIPSCFDSSSFNISSGSSIFSSELNKSEVMKDSKYRDASFLDLSSHFCSSFHLQERIPEFSAKENDYNGLKGSNLSPLPLVSASLGEPLMGLKLGKRTYFEDVSAGNSIRITAASSEPSLLPGVVKRFHGLLEFDDRKRSCRRRLADHNARRRKSQPDAILLNPSRTTSSHHDCRSLERLALDPVASTAATTTTRSSSSSWEDTYGLRFARSKASWESLTEESHVANSEMPSFDRMLMLRDAPLQTFHQGIEAGSAGLEEAPDRRRALSLLSSDSWGSTMAHSPAYLTQ